MTGRAAGPRCRIDLRSAASRLAGLAAALLACVAAVAAAPQTTIRATVELVTVDLVVRDRSGAPVGGLMADDFEVLEDGVPQRVTLFDALGGGAATPGSSGPGTVMATVAPPAEGLPDETTGSMVLLFDLAAMRPDEVDRAVDAAARYVQESAPPHVHLGVATVTSDLQWLTDLTTDREAILGALDQVVGVTGFAEDTPTPRTLAMDEAAALPIDDGGADAPEGPTLFPAGRDDLTVLTNDRRLRALAALARGLERLGRKKAVLYFSGGLARSDLDNDVELRAAVNAAVRANVAIYPVDAAGLQTITPGGDVTRSRPAGVDLFSGADVVRQFDDLARAEDTLVTLAADTGGRAFLDTNDFRDAFARAVEDLSTYYLIGYQSTNTARDGRFRRIQVRVRRPGLRVDTRAGYYADLDFAHASRADREARLAAELAAPLSSTDLPVVVSAAWFRLTAEEYDVPVAVAVPGWRIPAPPGITRVPLDVIGELRDEDHRPVSRLRQTATIALGPSASLSEALLVYRARLRLPPGRFVLKIVVRENLSGQIGSYEAPLIVPDLSRRALETSVIVLRAGAGAAPAARWSPHPTRVVGSDQPLRFYVEAYDPGGADTGQVRLRTGLSCMRDEEPTVETPLTRQTAVDRSRRAVRIMIELPAGTLPAGVQTCQINVIDDHARRFTFPRITFAVR